jgi:trk system potassium uptake protein TrkA
VLALQDLRVREVHVKVVSEAHARIAEKLGATSTVFPERDMGKHLAEAIANTSVLNFVALGPDFSVQEMAVPDSWLGKSLRELDVRGSHGISVVGRHDMLTDTVVSVPDPDTPLTESDTLYVAGSTRDLEALVPRR